MASWLGGSAALAVLSFDVDAESVLLAEDPRHAQNAMLMSHQAYGPSVGVPRILDLLADHRHPLPERLSGDGSPSTACLRRSSSRV